MEQRMYNHGKYGHLPKKCYQSVKTIEYLETASECDGVVLEVYFINFYAPEYNKESKGVDGLNIEIPTEYRWKKYEMPHFKKSHPKSMSICDIRFELLSDLLFRSIYMILILMSEADKNGNVVLNTKIYRKYRDKRMSNGLPTVIRTLQISNNAYLKECIDSLHIENGNVVAKVKKKERTLTEAGWNILRNIKKKYVLLLALWLMKYSRNGRWYIEASKLQQWLRVPESYDFSRFNDKVLTPAIKNLRQYFEGLTMAEFKEGRKVVGIAFFFDRVNDGITEHKQEFIEIKESEPQVLTEEHDEQQDEPYYGTEWDGPFGIFSEGGNGQY